MKERHVDARGLSCPQPVVITRKAILEAGVEKVQVVVDNDVSAENVQRMAINQGWEVSLEKVGAETRMTLTPPEGAAGVPVEEPRISRGAPPGAPKVVVLVSSSLFGTGEEQLGRILMRAFIKTLKDLDPRPGKLIFANSGVWLTTEGSDLIDDLRELAQRGIEIISCGTCLDYYHLLDLLKVGVASNMYEIASSLVEADRVVRP